jgi:hypothetical protein
LQAPFHIACLVIPTADLFSWKFLCINKVLHVSDISSVGCLFTIIKIIFAYFLWIKKILHVNPVHLVNCLIFKMIKSFLQ